MNQEKRITVVCGHYGCGKTNLSINLALELAREIEESPKQEGMLWEVTLLDMDIVNPYFRSSEYGELLSRHSIRLISPVFAGSTLDVPTLPPEMYAAFANERAHVIMDAGGDDAGITALGSIRTPIMETEYQMIYVINKYRILSQTPEQAVTLLKEIEEASGLKATAIVNNSHLGVETTLETVEASMDFAQQTAELCGLPLLYHTVPDFAVKDRNIPKALSGKLKVIGRYVQFPWEQENEI